MSNVIAFPVTKIPNADFDTTADDVCADRLLTITTRMQERAQCAMSDADRKAMMMMMRCSAFCLCGELSGDAQAACAA